MDKITQERIKADAGKRFPCTINNSPLHVKAVEHQRIGYIAGATAENSLSKILLDALEQIAHAPVPANEREFISWFITAKNVASGAISAYEAENEVSQWKDGKEVGNE